MSLFSLVLGVLSLLATTSGQRAIRGSRTHLSTEWLGELPESQDCHVRFLARNSMCGRVSPASFLCRHVSSAVYQHMGCLEGQDVVSFLITDDTNFRRLRALAVRVVSRSTRLVSPIGNADTERGGQSKPFGIKISTADGQDCAFSLSSPIPWMRPRNGRVDGLKANMRYACQIGLHAGLIYRHNGEKSNEDFIPVSVWLTHQDTGKLQRVEYDLIRVHVMDSTTNVIPRVISSSSLTLLVRQLSVTPVLPTVLAADDDDDKSSDLVISFASGFDPRVTGVLFSLDNPYPVYGDMVNVTQGEINAGKVAYRPPVIDTQRTMTFPFEVIDRSGGRLSSQLFVELVERDEDIPYVILNSGLVVERGGIGVINTSVLRIASNNDLAAVTLHVTHRPLAGRVRVVYNGVQGDASVILVEDLENDRVFYDSDESVSLESDRLIFEISDGEHSFLCYFPIWLYTTQPRISVSTLTAHRNEAVMISDGIINIDCPGCDAFVVLDDQSVKGKVYLRGKVNSVYINTVESPDNLGQTASAKSFSQSDISAGRLWYVPPRNKAVQLDSLIFRVSLPSSNQTVSVKVQIVYSIDEGVQLVDGVTLMMMVKEKSTSVLTGEAMSFVSKHSSRADIKYVVTDAPSFVSSQMEEEDAGQIVWSSKVDEVAYEFTQEDVVRGRLSYKAPIKDIGLKTLTVEFRFRVSDKTSLLLDQQFIIEIEPTDDMSPEIVQGEDIIVQEDESFVISSHYLKAKDPDTPINQLQFTLTDVPRYGMLTLLDRNVNLTTGDGFTMVDINSEQLLYSHSGVDVHHDQFNVMLSDGHHSIVATIPILIESVDGDVPRLIDVVSYNVSVSAFKSRILIGSDSLLVFDPDTPDSDTQFTLKTSLRFGELELKLSRGVYEAVTVFTQSNITAKRVYYHVINHQLLSANVTERLMFSVGEGRRTRDVDFEVHIMIPDSQALSVVMASPFRVLEASSQAIETQHLSVDGATIRLGTTQFTIREYPRFGIVSVRGLTGLSVSTFTLMDVRLMQVTYLQTRHQGIEPLHDSFVFDVTDGLATLSGLLFNITIIPVDEEPPVVIKGHPGPIVPRKGSLRIRSQFIKIVDADAGSTDGDIRIRLTVMPQHGHLSLLTNRDELKSLQLRDSFTADDLHNLRVVYTHDGSLSEKDLFNISVSDGYHVVEDYLEIEISNPNIHRPVVVNNTGLVILQNIQEVQISSVNLSAVDEDSQPIELLYTITGSPVFGMLQIQSRDSGRTVISSVRKGSHFTQSDIDRGHVFYTHDGQSIGVVVFVFSLSDGKHEIRRQRFHIKVRSVDREPPIVVTNKGLTLKAGTSRAVMPSELRVKDSIALANEVAFRVVNSTFLGFFSMVGNVEEVIDQFSQADVDTGRVLFVHLAGQSTRLADIVVFHVSDGFNEIEISFVVQVTPDPAFLPKLVNEGISAFSNEKKTLDSFSLSLVNSETPDEAIIFTIVSLPLYGQLRLSHRNNRNEILAERGVFTQHDIINGAVSYIFLLQGSATDKDSFRFQVFDPGYSNYTILTDKQSKLQSSISIQIFTVSVITVDVKPPVMVTNTGFDYLLALEGGLIGRPLSRRVLQAGDDITDQSDLRYVIRDGPKHGELRSLGRQQVVHFRQRDIDAGLVVYVLRDRDMAITHDHFTFSVKDEMKNVLNDLVFNISWVYLTMETDRLEVRETDGTANVTVRRIGNPDIQVSFTCKTESGTALEALPGFHLREGRSDFQPVSSLHTLAPGEVTAQCLVSLTDDSKYEGVEVFKVNVMHSVFAHVGEPSYVKITIVDPEDEPVFGFETTSVDVSEDVGDMQLQVKRTGDLTDTVSVICYTQSGSATGSTPPYLLTGDDYVTRTNSRLSKIVFEPGASVKMCSIRILDDTLAEGSEMFSVHLVTREMGVKLSNNGTRVDVTIVGPNDESRVQFSSSSYHVNESSNEAAITIKRVGSDVSFPVSVWFTTKDNKPVSAHRGEDYIQLSKLVAFPPGVRQQIVKVRIVDDDVEEGQPVLEGLETFGVMLVSAVRVGIGHPDEATVTIDDWEDTATVEFSVSAVVTDEGPLLQLEVTRSGATNFLTKVRCYTRSGSAEKSSDFVDRPNTDMSLVTFSRGDVRQKCYVIILDDNRLEGEESFTVLLGSPSGGARLGLAAVRVTIRDPNDVPTIQFESVAMTVSEPTSPNQRDSSILTLVLQRVGDLNMTSSVRVHTQDGSAKSGTDYEPLSNIVTFKPFERRKTATTNVLFDREEELGETFFVVLSLLPHSLDVRLGSKLRVSVTIADFTPSGVSFLLKPKVLSLVKYGSVLDGESAVSSGYPVICVSSCDPRFGNPKALDHCTKELIDHPRTQYRWEVAEPEASSPLREVTFTSPFAGHSSVTLDSVYFKRGSRLRCFATPVDSKGVTGLERASRIVTVGQQGVCNPDHPIQLDPGEIETRMRHVGGTDRQQPESVETVVQLPHVDGYIPLISTHPLGSLALALTIPAARSEHVCSNLVMGAEQRTLYGFVQQFVPGSEPTGVGFNYPYQFDSGYRDLDTLSLYQYLDLKKCQWMFRTWFTISELLNDCGAQISQDTTHATITTPLYISYVHFSASTVWRFVTHTSKLVLTLSSTSLDNPTGLTSPLPEDYSDQGQIYPSRMYIRQSDSKLEMHFLSISLFRGQFVMSHAASAYVSHVEAPTDSVPFDLELVDSEPTVHRVKQKWRIVSEYSLPNYVGKYGLVLVPCKVAGHVQWSTRFSQTCDPGDPIEFFVRVDFQQTLSPQPVSYGLNTLFELLHDVESFLRDPSVNREPLQPQTNRPFRRGDMIYGRVMVDPSQELREGFRVLIERVFLCAGRDGYVPSYDPTNNHYGCLEPSIELAYRFKTLDRENPTSIDVAFQSIPFQAEFASDNSSYDRLTQQHDDDGFTTKVAPLYMISSGYSWHLQVVYSIKGNDKTMSRNRRQSSTTNQDNTNQYTGLGTAIHEIPLIFGSDEDSRGRDEEPTESAVGAAGVEDTTDNSIALAVILGLVIPLVCVLLLVLVVVIWRHRKREGENKSTVTNQGRNENCRKESGVSIQHGNNPYLTSFLNVRSDNENSGVDMSGSDDDDGHDDDDDGEGSVVSVVIHQAVEECDSDASSAKSEDYSGDVSEDNTSYYSERFKTAAGGHQVMRDLARKRAVAQLVDSYCVTSL